MGKLLNAFLGEQRSTTSLNHPSFTDIFNVGKLSTAGVSVNEASALQVPAIYAATNHISDTVASLPFHLMKEDGGKTVKATKDPTYAVVHDRVSDVMTSQQWRKWMTMRLLLDGRATSVILVDRSNRPVGFIPLEQCDLDITQTVSKGKVSRTYKHKGKTYSHEQVIDVVKMPRADGFSHYSPIELNRNAIGLMIAAEDHASKLFASGGVPPLALHITQTTMSPEAVARADDHFRGLLAQSNRMVVPVPAGQKLDPLGIDPQKQQLIELRRFQVEETCRIFNIQPSMLHALEYGSFSNVEQQALAYVKHTIAPLVALIEAEMNLKLFNGSKKWVKFNLDGLQRGDFQSRMDGLSKAIAAGHLTPNEARALEDRAALDGGDQLLIQGAMVPITQAGQANATNGGQPEDPTG